MTDLISRKAAQAIKVLPKCYREYKTGNLDDAYEEGWEGALLSLNALPTIDPVKHGTWIPYLITTNPPTYFFGCSLCNGAVEKNTKYCPHCGAMIERSEE